MLKQQDVVRAVATKVGFTRADVRQVIRALQEVIEDELVYGDGVRFGRLGVFTHHVSPERKMKIPWNGRIVDVPSKKKVAFRVHKWFARQVDDHDKTLKKTIDEAV